jgi:hypothetical protein
MLNFLILNHKKLQQKKASKIHQKSGKNKKFKISTQKSNFFFQKCI